MPKEKQKQVPPAHHATEFLANERTFLAWVRTGIAVISLGFAVTKFDAWLNKIAEKTGTAAAAYGNGWSIPMGLVMIGLGGLLPALAAWRYCMVNRQIENGEVKADRSLIVFVTGLVMMLALMFILYLLKSERI